MVLFPNSRGTACVSTFVQSWDVEPMSYAAQKEQQFSCLVASEFVPYKLNRPKYFLLKVTSCARGLLCRIKHFCKLQHSSAFTEVSAVQSVVIKKLASPAAFNLGCY